MMLTHDDSNFFFVPNKIAIKVMDLIIQGTVLELQVSLEDGMERARGKPSVILCDRGFMDGAAYMGNERFKTFLQSRKKDIADAREGRYNDVIHMAADGAPSFYSLEDNVARSETPEEAIALDQKDSKSMDGPSPITCIG
jgi:AAA domain